MSESPRHTTRAGRIEGRDAIVLSSPAAGGITATIVPSAGAVVSSLHCAGAELLGQRSGLTAQPARLAEPVLRHSRSARRQTRDPVTIGCRARRMPVRRRADDCPAGQGLAHIAAALACRLRVSLTQISCNRHDGSVIALGALECANVEAGCPQRNTCGP